MASRRAHREPSSRPLFDELYRYLALILNVESCRPSSSLTVFTSAAAWLQRIAVSAKGFGGASIFATMEGTAATFAVNTHFHVALKTSSVRFTPLEPATRSPSKQWAGPWQYFRAKEFLFLTSDTTLPFEFLQKCVPRCRLKV